MKVLKIVVLTLLISFLLFAGSIYITFKYILTPERIKNYVESYVERTVKEQLEKGKTELLDKIYLSRFMGKREPEYKKIDEKIESFTVLESFPDVNLAASKFTNMDILGKIDDVNLLASKLFNNANVKMEALQNKITEYFRNKNIQEE